MTQMSLKQVNFGLNTDFMFSTSPCTTTNIQCKSDDDILIILCDLPSLFTLLFPLSTFYAYAPSSAYFNKFESKDI